MFALWSDPEVCRYSGKACDFDGHAIALPAASSKDSDRIIDFFVRGADAGTAFRWAVILTAGRLFIGTVGFNALGTSAEFAYHLIPECWGQGLMREASRPALAWLKSRGDCEEVEAFIEPENLASIGFATRLGFRATGDVSDGTQRYALSKSCLDEAQRTSGRARAKRGR
jgi:ribosomal-protein-alanine N-acetyltransferase